MTERQIQQRKRMRGIASALVVAVVGAGIAFVAFTGGSGTPEPVASGSAYVGDRLVRVDNIATLESARGRGYGLALTAFAAAVDPSKPATLIASDLGRPVYDRLGFVAVMRFTYWLGLRS